MVPQFSAEIVAKLMRTKRPTLMAGVPDALRLARARPCAREEPTSRRSARAFSGADTLQQAVRDRFEALVAERGGDVRLLEGYGLTEAVTAILASPLHEHRGSGRSGIAFPDMLVEICAAGDRACAARRARTARSASPGLP